MNANTSSASPSERPGSGADPVDWEARYRAGDTPWDEGFAAPPLTDFLARHPVSGRVLVPGCGPGHDVRALALQGAEVTGLDLSETALRIARGFAPAGEERYEQGNLFTLPQEWSERFDWVVEHTCFCAIPPASRAEYVGAIGCILKPGGLYLGIFYLNPSQPQGPPHGVTVDEISRLFDPSMELLEEWVPRRSFEGREGRELCQLRRKIP